jgi:cytochrome P450
MHNFVLAMVLHPAIQKRIQAEIDSAVGPGRLPTMADSSQLPYLNAVLRELIRWQPISPIGASASSAFTTSYLLCIVKTALPHRLMTDDVYNGACGDF